MILSDKITKAKEVKNVMIILLHFILSVAYISISKLIVKEILFIRIVEAVFTMFYRLGLIFFNDPKFNNATPGQIADIFFSRPIRLLEKAFGFMSFFSIFINIGKLVLLIVCLWICGKIIAIYISNIFMALMLVTFSIFFLLFLTMEGTAEIGQRGIRIIVIQSVTLFMTVAMMGISYQVIKLIEVGDSIPGIASLAVILLMLQLKYIYGIDVSNIFNIFLIIFNNGRNSRNRTERDKNNSNTVGNIVYDGSDDGDIVSGNKADRSRRQYTRDSVISGNIVNVTTGNGRNKHNGDSNNIRRNTWTE